MTDTELQRLMFAKESLVSKNKRMPDYDYIHKELLRNGVSKKLLWTEYMEDCRDIVNIGLHFFLKNVRPYAASCSEA